MPWKRIEPAPGEVLEMVRVATFEKGCLELVPLNSGLYRPHVQDGEIYQDGKLDFRYT